jgi:ribosome recycling factor
MNAEALAAAIAAADRKLVPHEVPEWGLTVYVRALSLEDRLALIPVFEGYTPEMRVGVLVVKGTYAENGERAFKDEDAARVARMDSTAVGGIAAKVRELSKIGVTAEEAGAEKKAS